MKRNWKRLLSSVLALVMVLAMLPVSALADSAADDAPSTSTGLQPGEVRATKSVVDGPDSDGYYTIELTVEGKPVTKPVAADVIICIDISNSMDTIVTKSSVCGGEIKEYKTWELVSGGYWVEGHWDWEHLTWVPTHYVRPVYEEVVDHYYCAKCGKTWAKTESHPSKCDANYGTGGSDSTTSTSRLDIAKQAASHMVEDLLDGENNIRVAVVAFEGTDGGTSNKEYKHVSYNTNGLTQTASTVKSFISGLKTPKMSNSSDHQNCGGTNYSLALDQAKKLLDARKGNDTQRASYVLFLSDGAPGSNNGSGTDSTNWNGTTQANALKGTPYNTTIYSGGIAVDKLSTNTEEWKPESDQAKAIRALKAIASTGANSEKLYKNIRSESMSDDLTDLMNIVVTEAKKAAGTNAVMTDFVNTTDFDYKIDSQTGVTDDKTDGKITWNIGEITEQPKSITLKVKPKDGKVGDLHTNTDVTLTYTDAEGKTANKGKNAIGDPIVHIAAPDLSVTKTVTSVGSTTVTGSTIPAAKVGDKIVWTITVSNSGDAAGQISDPVDKLFKGSTDTTGSALTVTTTATKGTDGKYTVPAGTISQTDNTKLVPGSITFTVEYTVTADDAGKTLTNSVTIPEINPNDPEESTGVSVESQYTVHYELNGGTGSVPGDTKYNENDPVPVTTVRPTKTGAVFAGWEITTNDSDVAAPTITYGKFTMPAANVTLTAKWTNTYTLTYANGNGENPANVVFPTPNPKTGIISGTSETLGTASTSDTTKGAVVGTWEFEGWYKEAALTNRAGTPVTVTSDTTVYAKWKFTPTQYTLSYENDGGTIASTADYTKAGSVANGTSIDTPTSSEITKTGFNFGGWYTDKDLTKAAATDLKMPTSDLTLYAKWIPAGNTAYTVEHYHENLNADTYYKVAADTENLTGTTGETAYATPKNYTGFTYDSSVEGTVASGEITADGTLVLKLFYKRDSYAVTYQYTNAPADATLPTESSQEYGASVTVKDATVVNGYTFNGWTVQQPSGVTITTGADGKRTFTMPAEAVVLTGSYSANSGIEYKIEYYFENLEGTEFEKDNAKTVTKTGETNQNVKIQEADKKTFDGFTWDSTDSKNVLEGNITADGKLILKLYYTRNSYKVTYSYTGTAPTGASTLPTEQTYKYGAAVTVAAKATADGYSFNGWNPTPSVTISDKQFTMPASAVTLTGSFELIPVPGLTVEKKLTGVNNKTYENYTGKVEVGDKLTWTITVTNTGDTTLSNIVVTDQFNGKGTLNAPDFVDGKFVIASLESGKSVSTQVTYTVLKSDANTTITNTAYAVILNNDGNVDPNAPSDNDTSEVEVKKIEEKVEGDADLRVEKTVSDKNPKVGDTITYTIVVTNTGEADLWNVRISDDFDGNGELDFSEKIPYLGEGMSKEFTYTYKVVEADRGEKLTNRVTVRGETDGGQTPSDTDKVVVTVDSTQTPANAIIRPSLNARDHVAYIIGYVDGTVRPENDITRSEVAAIFFRLLTDDSRALYWSQYNSYSDVSADAWYNNAVSTLSNAGIITGYTDGTFRPDQPITRAEFAAISARFSDVVYGGTATFPDVPATYWAYKYISLAQYLGWVQGMPDGNFYPAKNITRAEAITMINRVLDRDVEKDHMLGNMVTWTDNTPDKWYYEAVQEATNSHLYSRSYIYATGQDFFTEIWRSITENPDWAALEKAWSTANSK